MGGLGSGGRGRTSGKPTTDDHHSLDVRPTDGDPVQRAGLSVSEVSGAGLRKPGEDAVDRASRRLRKAAAALDWRNLFFEPPGEKPKGMHLRTYLRRLQRFDAALKSSSTAFGDWSAATRRRIETASDPNHRRSRR
ncbi:MAG: hypothetical protein ACRDD1_19345 [Planctomycetia bacterium]